MASAPCRNCWYTPATWSLSLSYIRRNPEPTAPAYGLTRGLRISSRHLMAVRMPLASTGRSRATPHPHPPPKEMSPHTITEPLPNRSCWRTLQAAEHSPQQLQTPPRLSHALSVNLPSSAKSTGCQWWICQSWCSLAHAKRPVWHLAVSATPTWSRWALTPPSWSLFLPVWAHTTTSGACWRLFCRAPPVPPCTKAEVAVLLTRLLSSYGLLHVSRCSGLSPGSASMLWKLRWQTQQTLSPQLAELPEPLVWVVDVTLPLE